jgi:hypothetical protein
MTTPRDAVMLLVGRFPAFKPLVEEDDLYASPHIAYSLLASKVLEHPADVALLSSVARFADELANSGSCLLEELLVIDILEGIAQDPAAATRLRLSGIGSRVRELLARVEAEFYRRAAD